MTHAVRRIQAYLESCIRLLAPQAGLRNRFVCRRSMGRKSGRNFRREAIGLRTASQAYARYNLVCL